MHACIPSMDDSAMYMIKPGEHEAKHSTSTSYI